MSVIYKMSWISQKNMCALILSENAGKKGERKKKIRTKHYTGCRHECPRGITWMATVYSLNFVTLHNFFPCPCSTVSQYLWGSLDLLIRSLPRKLPTNLTPWHDEKDNSAHFSFSMGWIKQMFLFQHNESCFLSRRVRWNFGVTEGYSLEFSSGD